MAGYQSIADFHVHASMTEMNDDGLMCDQYDKFPAVFGFKKYIRLCFYLFSAPIIQQLAYTATADIGD